MRGVLDVLSHARTILDSVSGDVAYADTRFPEIAETIDAIDTILSPTQDPQYAPFIAVARQYYAERSSDDVEIDDTPMLSDARGAGGDDGVWVNAWVWVSTADAIPETDDDERSNGPRRTA